MTDERIKEEFEKWTPSNPTTQEFDFLAAIDNPAWQCEAVGFYAGFRAAERLAKIEALEAAKIKARECYFPQYVYELLNDMIAELKATIAPLS